MNHEQALRRELRSVGERYRRLLLGATLAACWMLLAAAGLVLLALAHGAGYAVPGIALVLLVALPIILLPILVRALRAVRDPMWVARRVEQRFPDLDARLLAALDQRAERADAPLGFLQHTVLREALDHAGGGRWEQLVPPHRLRVAQVAQWATLVAFLAVLVQLVVDMDRRPGSDGWLAGGATGQRIAGAFDVNVEPEDTELERGTGLLVLARFGGEQLPGEVQLLYRTTDGQEGRMPMSKSLDDPVFAGRVASVNHDLTYAVRYGDEQTRWYKASVFDYPDLKQADARLKFPEYTGLEEKLVEGTRSVTAVEGTRATFTFRLNKPVADAQLLPGRTPAEGERQPAAAPVAAMTLKADAADPSLYTVAMDLKQSQRFRLQLVDAQGRHNREPPELVVNVTQNRPPELKLQWPGRDVDVSPLEELSIKAQAWDDFGLRRVGVSYGLAGRNEQDVVLLEGAKAKETRDVSQLVSMEKLAAKPDELLSYYVWAEDIGPDGQVRRTSGDMFFAEVRDFEQIFRQGQQPAGGEQEQQQQGGQNGQQAEQLAELQKQIIAATWKLIRREVGAAPTAEFVADATLVGQSQTDVHAQAEALGEQLQDVRSRAHLKNVLKHMDEAVSRLADAAGGPEVNPLRPAMSSEQAAYQELLKLRAREIEVVRGQRQQQQGQQSSSSASARRQQQLEELELDQEENRYETQRSAAARQQETAEQRETRQVLNRLRELAQRQEDLNRQMRELQSALEQAEEEARREEIKRQLARLRDQQQQMLRDTDELRDRMDQPENQQRMAESREQLEQTRENVRQASEALEEGKVPEAQAQGARAGEQLNQLRDDFRKAAAGQFDEAMDRMRQDARELDRKQQELSEQLTDLDPESVTQRPQPGLREGGERQEVARGLQEQKQELERLLEDMRQTIEESETAEPLLSKKLYDAVRDTRQQKTDQALDASGELLDRGFIDEAKRVEAEAARGVTKLREGVERAAESVLGDEAEALRRARDELDALAQDLEREIGRRDPNASAEARQPSTQPGGERRVARSGATTRESIARAGEEQERQGRRSGGETRPGRADRGQDSGERQARGAAPAPEQEDARAPGGSGDRESEGGEQAGEDRPGQGAPGETEMADAGQGEPPGGQAGAQGQPGQRGQARQDGESSQEEGPRRASARGGGLRQRSGTNQGGGGGGEREPGDDLRQFLPNGGGPGGRDERTGGPITGEGFRDWSDRLRDVEESVSDPRLRAEAARIRDRAREVRSEFKRYSEEPNWDLVREFVSEPLVELRDRVQQELMRRESPTALVPIDREPVAPEYADQVRRYYERLGGSGGGE